MQDKGKGKVDHHESPQTMTDLALTLQDMNIQDPGVCQIKDTQALKEEKLDCSFSLLMKVASTGGTARRISLQALEQAMARAWREKFLKISQVSHTVFMAHFRSQEDMCWVYLKQPWTMNSDNLLFEWFDPLEKVSSSTDYRFDQIFVTIRAYGVPCKRRTTELLKDVLRQIGNVSEFHVLHQNNLFAKQDYMWGTVQFQITNPVKDRVMVTYTDGSLGSIYLHFEKVRRICLFCGIMFHTVQNCAIRTRLLAEKLKNKHHDSELPVHRYGQWITDEDCIPLSILQATRLETSSDDSQSSTVLVRLQHLFAAESEEKMQEARTGQEQRTRGGFSSQGQIGTFQITGTVQQKSPHNPGWPALTQHDRPHQGTLHAGHISRNESDSPTGGQGNKSRLLTGEQASVTAQNITGGSKHTFNTYAAHRNFLPDLPSSLNLGQEVGQGNTSSSVGPLLGQLAPNRETLAQQKHLPRSSTSQSPPRSLLQNPSPKRPPPTASPNPAQFFKKLAVDGAQAEHGGARPTPMQLEADASRIPHLHPSSAPSPFFSNPAPPGGPVLAGLHLAPDGATRAGVLGAGPSRDPGDGGGSPIRCRSDKQLLRAAPADSAGRARRRPSGWDVVGPPQDGAHYTPTLRATIYKRGSSSCRRLGTTSSLGHGGVHCTSRSSALGDMLRPYSPSPSRSASSATRDSDAREEPWPLWLGSPAHSEGSEDSCRGAFSPPQMVGDLYVPLDAAHLAAAQGEQGKRGVEAQLGAAEETAQHAAQSIDMQEDTELAGIVDDQAMAPAFKAPRGP